MKNHFLLDPNITFLNHGSYGACPSPVFNVYQEWQRRLERQPVQFISRELLDHLAEARSALSAYLNVPADNLVFIPNATFGVNLVARSIDLRPGDQVLTTDHEYGACMNAWQFISRRVGFEIVKQPIPLSMLADEDILELFWQVVTERTRMIFLSHITSPTAIRFPVQEICRKARDAGILTLIDGAHAPGHIDLNLDDIGADFYTGNCHKWMMAPKGSAFLYSRKDVQSILEPLVVSWGWGENRPWPQRTPFLDGLEYSGTNDYSAYLSVPAAIDFMMKNDWGEVRQQCNSLLIDELEQLDGICGLTAPVTRSLHNQMGIIQLPPLVEGKRLQTQLWDQSKIEIPCITFNNDQFLRISVQGYNTVADLDYFSDSLVNVLVSC